MSWNNLNDENKLKFNIISSAFGGIIPGNFYLSSNESNLHRLIITSSNMPNYTRFLFKEEKKFNFHISGYDLNINNSFVRMCGETIERYSGIISHSLISENDKIRTSYKELIKSHKNVIDKKWMKPFSDKKLKQINKYLDNFSEKQFNDNEVIEWIPIYSINKNDYVYLPSQMFFLVYPEKLNDEKRHITTVSTGTATHINFDKALKNSLIEAIQINAFNHNWYFNKKAKKINIDDESIINEINKIIGNARKKINLEFQLYTDDESDLITIGCYIFNKENEYPAIAFGIQCSESKHQAIIRSLCESLAVYDYCLMMGISKNIDVINKDKNNQAENFYSNLDENVIYFSNVNNVIENKNEINKKWNQIINYSNISDSKLNLLSEKDFNKLLIKKLINKNEIYIMNITPPEVKNIYSVCRIFIPQFLPVFLPSMPYDNHPLIRDKKINKYIHPLA